MNTFISWNVNGLRAAVKKNFMEFLRVEAPDIIALQEIKMRPDQADFTFEEYHAFWNSADKAGYAGTLVLSRVEPLRVTYGIDGAFNEEGRVITLEFDKVYVVTAYVPNAQRELTRLDYRMGFEDDLRKYLMRLDKEKPVIYCGDLNVAHQAIDLKNPKANERNAGYTIEERTKMSALLEAGFTDVFRALHPDEVKYTWWSYRFNARRKNIGWRIDYFLVSDRFLPRVKSMSIMDDIDGSDHCPVKLVTETLG